jgi:hypothetical protein
MNRNDLADIAAVSSPDHNLAVTMQNVLPFPARPQRRAWARDD